MKKLISGLVAVASIVSSISAMDIAYTKNDARAKELAVNLSREFGLSPAGYENYEGVRNGLENGRDVYLGISDSVSKTPNTEIVSEIANKCLFFVTADENLSDSNLTEIAVGEHNSDSERAYTSLRGTDYTLIEHSGLRAINNVKQGDVNGTILYVYPDDKILKRAAKKNLFVKGVSYEENSHFRKRTVSTPVGEITTMCSGIYLYARKSVPDKDLEPIIEFFEEQE
jgi:hypothetical protein